MKKFVYLEVLKELCNNIKIRLSSYLSDILQFWYSLAHVDRYFVVLELSKYN